MSLRTELGGRIDTLRAQIEGLETEVSKLVRQRTDLKDEVGLSETILSLRKRIAELEITEAKKQEAFDREKREVEHMVGLERKKAAFETDSARREAELSVRESNLSEERRLFEEKMTAVTSSLENQVKYLQDNLVTQLMGAVTAAMPDTSIALGNGRSRAAKVS